MDGIFQIRKLDWSAANLSSSDKFLYRFYKMSQKVYTKVFERYNPFFLIKKDKDEYFLDGPHAQVYTNFLHDIKYYRTYGMFDLQNNPVGMGQVIYRREHNFRQVPTKCPIWEIYNIFLDTEKQGRGFGYQLLEYLENSCNEKHPILLSTYESDCTMKFYRNAGYELIGANSIIYPIMDKLHVYKERIYGKNL